MNNIKVNILGSDTFSNLLKELEIFNLTDPASKNIKNVIRIIFVDNYNSVELKKIISQQIPSIYLTKNTNLFKKKKLLTSNFEAILSLPIELISIIEIVKILFTKFIFFANSNITINKDYLLDANKKIIFKDNSILKLTEKEINLILELNKNSGVGKNELLRKIWNYNKTDIDSHAFETNLHRLRKKIFKVFKDSNFILERNSKYYLVS
jgi:DNA-binding response OmpR family regulator